MPMTRIGIWAANSAIRSNRFVPISGSRQAAENARIFGSNEATVFGVNIFDTNLRWMVCVGASS